MITGTAGKKADCFRATGGNWPSRRDKPDVAAPLSMNRETDIPCSKKASGK